MHLRIDDRARSRKREDPRKRRWMNTSLYVPQVAACHHAPFRVRRPEFDSAFFFPRQQRDDGTASDTQPHAAATLSSADAAVPSARRFQLSRIPRQGRPTLGWCEHRLVDTPLPPFPE